MDPQRRAPIAVLAIAAAGCALCLFCLLMFATLVLDPPTGPGSDIGAGIGAGLVMIAYALFLPVGIGGGVAAVVSAGARRRRLPYTLLGLSAASLGVPVLYAAPMLVLFAPTLPTLLAATLLR